MVCKGAIPEDDCVLPGGDDSSGKGSSAIGKAYHPLGISITPGRGTPSLSITQTLAFLIVWRMRIGSPGWTYTVFVRSSQHPEAGHIARIIISITAVRGQTARTRRRSRSRRSGRTTESSMVSGLRFIIAGRIARSSTSSRFQNTVMAFTPLQHPPTNCSDYREAITKQAADVLA